MTREGYSLDLPLYKAEAVSFELRD